MTRDTGHGIAYSDGHYVTGAMVTNKVEQCPSYNTKESVARHGSNTIPCSYPLPLLVRAGRILSNTKVVVVFGCSCLGGPVGLHRTSNFLGLWSEDTASSPRVGQRASCEAG